MQFSIINFCGISACAGLASTGSCSTERGKLLICPICLRLPTLSSPVEIGGWGKSRLNISKISSLLNINSRLTDVFGPLNRLEDALFCAASQWASLIARSMFSWSSQRGLGIFSSDSVEFGDKCCYLSCVKSDFFFFVEGFNIIADGVRIKFDFNFLSSSIFPSQ